MSILEVTKACSFLTPSPDLPLDAGHKSLPRES